MTRHEAGGERAVSPVIGVILMVAITVILAAVVGAFVLGVGSGVTSVPQASFDFEVFEKSGQPDELLVTHVGGDTIPNAELYVSSPTQVQEESGSPGPADRLSWKQLGDDGDVVEAGDSVFVEPPDSDPEIEGKTFRIVWSVGDQSSVIAEWTG